MSFCWKRPIYSRLWFFQQSSTDFWELDHKEGWVLKNWCFQIVVLKTVESSLDSQEIKPVNPKKINSEYSLEQLMLKLQYFGHLIRRVASLEKTLMLGQTENKRRRGRQRMKWLDSITNSMDRKLMKLWVTVKHRGDWQAAVHGSQSVGHNLVIE